MWHDSPEDEIRHLKNELHSARRTIVRLLPRDLSDLIDKYRDCRTRSDTYQWEIDVVDAIIEKAAPEPKRVSYFEDVERAYCPLCGYGSQGPYEEGFAIPEGLRRHLTGWGNARQCRVMEQAFALAGEYWNSTVEEVERQKRAAKCKDKARRRKTEILFKYGPDEEPKLSDDRYWLGDQPRAQEELQWAEERLSQLGFATVVDDRVKSYQKDFEQIRVYADPHIQKKITFYIYTKNVGKRRRRSTRLGSFFIMDSWKHDLVKKFEERCRNAAVQ